MPRSAPRAPVAGPGPGAGPDRLRVRLILEALPEGLFEGVDGRTDIRVDVQTKTGFGPGRKQGKTTMSWELEVEVRPGKDGGVDFFGDAVHGRAGERFFYLSWSGSREGQRQMFRRIKVHLNLLPQDLARQAVASGRRVVGRIHAVARDGGPACASVPLLGDGWHLEEVAGTSGGRRTKSG